MSNTAISLVPGIFFLVNNNENDERNGRTDGRTREKIQCRPGVYCRGSSAVSAYAPTVTQILCNHNTSVNCLDSPVYSCILIRVSAFSEAAPRLLNHCMAFCALTGRSLLKPRQEALMHLYNGVCCMLPALQFIFDFKVEFYS